MGLFSRKAKAVKQVHRFDGPGAKGGQECASFNIYVHEDDSCRTIEFDRTGKHIHEYDGEPVFPDGTIPAALAEDQPPKSKAAAK